MPTELATPKIETQPPVPPIPGRWVWLRRGLLFLGIVLMAAALARWQWQRVADHRLRNEIASLRHRSIPVTGADFERLSVGNVPDQDNAAIALEDAAHQIAVAPNLRNYARLFNFDRPWTLADVSAINRIVSADSLSIALARLAINQSATDWNVPLNPITAQGSSFELIDLPDQHELSQLLVEAAGLAHRRGNDGQAIEDLLALFRLADALDQGPPLVQTHLAALEIYDSVAGLLDHYAPSMKLSAASRPRALLLVRRMMNLKSMRAAGIRAIYGQAAADRARLTGSAVSTGIIWLIRPMLILDARRVLGIDITAAQSLDCDSFRQASVLFPAHFTKSPSLLFNAAHLVSRSAGPRMKGDVYMHFKTAYQRQTAAVVLAKRLFTLDHGVPPRSLVELIPRYLPKPFVSAWDGRALGLKGR